MRVFTAQGENNQDDNKNEIQIKEYALDGIGDYNGGDFISYWKEVMRIFKQQ